MFPNRCAVDEGVCALEQIKVREGCFRKRVPTGSPGCALLSRTRVGIGSAATSEGVVAGTGVSVEFQF